MKVAKLFLLLVFVFIAWPCHAKLCRYFFSSTVKAPYELIFGGQDSVGNAYALYKELRDANLNPRLKLQDLTDKQKKVLMKSLLNDLNEPIPAVRDPSGRFFLLDGHHTIYLAAQLFARMSDIPIQLQLIYDAQLTGITWKEFVDLSIQEHWFYIPTAEAVITKPLQIHQLQNNIERSLLGLFFISIEDKYNVPMKGKHFKPFIQFYLADLIRQNGIVALPSKVDFDDMPMIRKTLLANPTVVDFLIEQLKPEAPNKLRDFLLSLKTALK